MTTSPPELRDARVLVTGGAGFIGSHLVDAIAAIGPRSLVVADSFFLGKRENLEEAAVVYPDLVIEEVDLASRDQATAVVTKHSPDVVFDLATVPLPYSLIHPMETIDINVAMAVNLCELQRLGHFNTLIHVSTSEVYGTAQFVPMTEEHPFVPLTPYAASKAAADHIVGSYVSTFGIDATIVRPFNNYGPRQNEGSYAGLIPITLRRLAAGEAPIVYGAGTQTRDFVFVGDTVRGLLAAAASPATRGTSLNLASGKETSVLEIIGALVEAVGVEVDIDFQPDRPGDVQRHFGSNARASELLGDLPRVSLHDGLAETVAWYLDRFEAAL